MAASQHPNRQPGWMGGFTLIELMVTLTVLAILLAIGVPSLQSFVTSSRLRAATQDLFESLQTARMEAIRRNLRVTVCKANANFSNCNNTGQWQQGWIVFVDQTPGVAPSVDSTDAIIQVRPPLGGDIVIHGNGGSHGTATYVSFTADGGSKQLNGAFMAGTLRVCSTNAALSDNTRARQIVINAAGRVVSEAVSGVTNTCPAP
ncbi:MAG: GspH/FimT family pseudopilin [Tepidimonas ignava]|uniref:GspH/FimT family pseudopilin n=1 Tax=Tepidimonas ignava TaxID=114249 RepID=UPI00391CB2CD